MNSSVQTLTNIDFSVRANWQVPTYATPLWLDKQHTFCVVIPVINEGERIKNLIYKMAALNIASMADIIIVDGGSKDGSLDLTMLQQSCVRGVVRYWGGSTRRGLRDSDEMVFNDPSWNTDQGV